MQDDEPDHSFDPKSWMKPKPEPGQKPGQQPDSQEASAVESDKHDDASFDPKSWLKGSGAPTADGKETQAKSALPSLPWQLPRLDKGLLIGLAIAAVIVTAGGITARLSYRAPAPGLAKSEPPPAAPGERTRVMKLSTLSDLPDAFAASGVSAAEAQEAAKTALAAIGAHEAGEIKLAVRLSGSGALVHLDGADIAFPDSSGATLIRTPTGGFAATVTAAALTTVMIVKRGEIDTTSFYSSAVTAGITDSLIPDFARAFYYDFDFQREINPGDIFEAGFEQARNAAGEDVGPPRLVYASLTTAAKSKALYFFQPKSGDAGWFDGNGRSIIKSFMRTPIDGAHVTSQFGIRVHPVQGFIKMHKGTDFGAPTGTPIYAAGDGVVTWSAMKGANGNLTIIQHDNGWLTYYLHQNAFAPGIGPGARVRQGETIGFVGTTGRSTGPHLHYEMHIDGEAVDAMKIPLEDGHALVGDSVAAFFKERDRIDTVRAQQSE